MASSSRTDRLMVSLQVLQAVVALLTLAVTIVLTILVAGWTVGQDQAKLHIYPVMWGTVGIPTSRDFRQYQGNWKISVIIQNEGPATATDLVLNISSVITDHITLKQLVIEHDNKDTALVSNHTGYDPRTGILAHWYTERWPQLSVGDALYVEGYYQVDDELSGKLHDLLADSTNDTFGYGGPLVQTYFLNHLEVSGNKMVVVADLWKR